jgi:hypothetical protein
VLQHLRARQQHLVCTQSVGPVVIQRTATGTSFCYGEDRAKVILSRCEPNRKQAVIAIAAAILAARKLATVPPNSPAAVAAIADAQKIVDRVEKSF